MAPPEIQRASRVPLSDEKHGLSFGTFVGRQRDYSPASNADFQQAEKMAVTIAGRSSGGTPTGFCRPFGRTERPKGHNEQLSPANGQV